jgi:hypothetical protein
VCCWEIYSSCRERRTPEITLYQTSVEEECRRLVITITSHYPAPLRISEQCVK